MSRTVSRDKLLVAPEETDDALLSRVDYEDQFSKASVWLNKLIVHRIKDVRAVAAHYRTGIFDFAEDERPISALFSQADGRFCPRLRYYCRKIKLYACGSVPSSMISQDYRLATILLDTLADLFRDSANVRQARRLVDAFHRLVSGAAGIPRSVEEYHGEIETLRAAIVKTFAKISDEACEIEHKARNAANASVTKSDVIAAKTEIVAAVEARTNVITAKQDVTLALAAEIGKTTNRIDRRLRRTRGNPKARHTPDELELIHTLWVKAQAHPSVKEASNHKPSYEAALRYFCREFRALRIVNSVDLKRAIKARSRRFDHKIKH